MDDWINIPGINTRYVISRSGEVYDMNKERRIFPHYNGSYLNLRLITDNGKAITAKLHRCIALAFIPNPKKLPIVDHIDRDKTNNRIQNLRWVSSKDSNLNRTSKPRRGSAVIQYSLENEYIKRHISLAEAGKIVNIAGSMIGRVCLRPPHIYRGFIWKFEHIPLQLEGEEWVPLNHPELPTCISVSNMGRVMKKGQILVNQQYNDTGYLVISFRDLKAKNRGFLIHRLILCGFLGYNSLEVNHKNKKRDDNRLANLEYVTRSEQMMHAAQGRKMPIDTSRAVLHLDEDYNVITRYSSVAAAAKALNCCPTSISNRCYGLRHGKYNVKFEGENLSVPRLHSTKPPKPVEQLDADGNVIRKFVSTKEAAIELKLEVTSITKICLGKQKQTKGTYWRYAS